MWIQNFQECHYTEVCIGKDRHRFNEKVIVIRFLCKCGKAKVSVIIHTTRLPSIIQIYITVTIFIYQRIELLSLCWSTNWSQLSGESGTVTAFSIRTCSWKSERKQVCTNASNWFYTSKSKRPTAKKTH